MLTKNDLYSIRQIVSGELGKELLPIKTNIKTLEINVNLMKKNLKNMKKDIRMIITLFDSDISETKLRVDRIETNLHLPTLV